MGYNSDVRSIIYGEPDKLQTFITMQKMKGEYILTTFEAEGILRRHQYTYYDNNVYGVLDLEYSGKWYTDDTEVQAWHNLLLDAEEFGLCFEFVRVGEDDTDVERDSSADSHGWIYPNTQIKDVFTETATHAPHTHERKEHGHDDINAEGQSADAVETQFLRDPGDVDADARGQDLSDRGDQHAGDHL